MLKLGETYELDRSLLTSDYLRHSPAPSYQIDTPDKQFFKDIPRLKSITFLEDSLL